MRSANWTARVFLITAWFLTGWMTASTFISLALRSNDNSACLEQRGESEVSEAEDVRVELADFYYSSHSQFAILHCLSVVGFVQIETIYAHNPQAQESHYQRGPPVA